MKELWVGLLSPGEMGAAVAASLCRHGRRVLSVLDGRSPQSAARAEAAGVEECSGIEDLVRHCQLVVSIVPPGAATAVAARLANAARSTGATPIVVDANAVNPATAESMSRLLEAAGASFVDGDLIGGPPGVGRTPTRLYLSGAEANRAAEILAAPELRAVVLEGPPLAASALKMAYASWTKGSAALVLTARALARCLGVEEALLAEWSESQPELAARCDVAARGAVKAWRFVNEMDEIAAAQRQVGLPSGFAEAASEIYRRLAFLKGEDVASLDQVLGLIEGGDPGPLGSGTPAASPEPDDLLQATDLCLRALAAPSEADWTVRAAGLEWSCRQTLEHLAGLAYGSQLAARAQ
jgi:3-hydroxyisobutyrate dehydrogenase-like beta-hydroxyacid dehydrogenase